MSHTVLVVGMHRSGTSVLAEMLTRWGIDPGPHDHLLQGDRWNPRGYWEYLPLIGFNDGLLRAIGATWNVPPSDRDDAAIAALAGDSCHVDRASALIHGMDAAASRWYWKDPRLTLLLPFWRALLPDAIYIVCLRNPVDIARSMLSRDGFPISASLLLWQLYMLKILTHVCHSSSPVLFVKFESLLASPESECERLSHFLSGHCGGQEAQPIREMRTVVDDALAHYRGDPSMSAVPQATREQKALWDHLLACADRGVERVEGECFGVYAGYKEYLEAIETLRQMGAVLQYRRPTFGAVEALT